MARQWHAQHDERGISIGEGFSFSPRVYFVNPTEKQAYARWGGRGRRDQSPSFVLWFGACGATYLHIYAPNLESALEECAGWLADHAPGHIDDEEHTALCKEAFADAGLTWTGDIDWEDRKQSKAIESAESDLTYTESGWLTSHEWGIALENPTTAELYAFIGGK